MNSNSYIQWVDESLISALSSDNIQSDEQALKAIRENNPQAIHTIGIAYVLMSMPQKALSWFNIAAALGYSESQEKIGCLYNHGYGVEQNKMLAKEWFFLAIRNGDIDALARAGHWYSEQGDHQTAMELYRQSADRNSYLGQFFIGALIINGNPVDADAKIARDWFLKSAEQDYPPAQYMLGELYENGHLHGLEVDFDIALKWFHKSSRGGYRDADRRIKQLNDRGFFYNDTDTDTDNEDDELLY